MSRVCACEGRLEVNQNSFFGQSLKENVHKNLSETLENRSFEGMEGGGECVLATIGDRTGPSWAKINERKKTGQDPVVNQVREEGEEGVKNRGEPSTKVVEVADGQGDDVAIKEDGATLQALWVCGKRMRRQNKDTLAQL